MVEKNEIANVWYIDNNELKNGNKVISKINYKGKEIAILKSERNFYYSNFLIKDKDNIYWNLGISPIHFEKFVSVNIDDTIKENKKYCDDIYNALSSLDLEKFFNKKMEKKDYFNKCELKYISKYYPSLYENALKCRNDFLEKRRIEEEQEKQKLEREHKEQVEIAQEILDSKISDIKEKIYLGEEVEIEEIVFYKDHNYINGKTFQNNILYLASQYGIEIPLATKGFINNRLVKYNFGTGNFSYKIIKNNKKASTKIHEYMKKIADKVQQEYAINKSKDKNKEVLEINT